MSLREVELQAAGMPCYQDVTTHIMLRFREVSTLWLLPTFRECKRIAALLCQPICAQPTEQHIIGRLILGMQFEAITLEQLGLEWLALDLNFCLCASREAKHRQHSRIPMREGRGIRSRMNVGRPACQQAL